MSSKFSCDLAEKLWDEGMEYGWGEEAGNSERGGWFTLIPEHSAILCVNSRGFVSIAQPEDLEAAWKAQTDQCAWNELDGLSTTCDGLFLILDTARHGGEVPDFEDVVRHIENCEECDKLGNYLEL